MLVKGKTFKPMLMMLFFNPMHVKVDLETNKKHKKYYEMNYCLQQTWATILSWVKYMW